MTSHYDRTVGPYAPRPSPIAGPSRGDPFYDREHRAVYPPRPEPEYTEEDHILIRRDERVYYPPQEYAGPSRESRGKSWDWQAPAYTRHPSPPSHPPVQIQYPRYYQDQRPIPSPQWEEHTREQRWENPPEDRFFERGFERSAAWRHHQHEPSNYRINSLLNPTSPSPGIEDRRWREPDSAPPNLPLPPHREYRRPPPPEYHHPYDDHPPAIYERPPFSDANAFIPNEAYRQQPLPERPSSVLVPNEAYRHQHLPERPSSSHVQKEAFRPHHLPERPAHWDTPTYRPEIVPAPRANRPSAISDYKRTRQASINHSPHNSDAGTPHWTPREKVIESRRSSREGSIALASPVPAKIVERERSVIGPSQVGSRNVFPLASSASVSPVPKASQKAKDISSDEYEYSDDEYGKDISRPVQALKQTLSDLSRSRDIAPPVNVKGKDRQAPVAPAPVEPVSRGRSQSNLTDKIPQRVIRQAWDPSTDQLVPIMDNNIHTSYQTDIDPRGFRQPGSEASRRSLQVYDLTVEDVLTVKNEAIGTQTSEETQGDELPRQGIMSVHNLVSPIPVKSYASDSAHQKPPTPLLLDENDMDIDPPRSEYSATQHARISEIHLQRQSRVPERDAGMNRQRSPSDEPSIIGVSQAVTPNVRTPDPDTDGALAEVENQVAKTTLSSPKPSILLQPGEKLSEDGTMRILAPRPKANKEDIKETLRKVIVLRRALSNQSREQRVNPILMNNLVKADGPEQQLTSPTGTLVEEVVERVLSESKDEHHLSARAILATNFAEQQELLAEKKQKLRDEYMKLHDRWTAHCARLDSLFKANDMQETLSQTGRTTRRSAATLGDAVRSDLEMEQIIASLGNEDMTDPNHLAVRNVATIPDMISVQHGHVNSLFDDTNNLVNDPETFYDLRSGFFDWTPEEEKIFYNKYADYPKQFGIISNFLPHKTSSQCVLYYYIHKKRIVDFRNAANSGNGKRRKGVRKGGKQKGNALLADVQQADSKRPAGRGRRRGRGGFSDSNRGRAPLPAPPPSTEGGTDVDPRPKRRRVTSTSKQFDFDDAVSVDTDNTREASTVPPKKRRGRKPKSVIVGESPADSPAPGETRFVDGSETPIRRKAGSASTHWAENEREIFMRLLALHGKDFKRISAELPNKTTVQVGNYYKNHNRELGLEKIANKATRRLASPDQDRFVTVSRAEASQSRTPTEEASVDQLADRQVADATSGIGVLTLGQTVFQSAPNPRNLTSKPVINVLDPSAFQSTEGKNRPRGVVSSSSSSEKIYSGEMDPTQMDTSHDFTRQVLQSATPRYTTGQHEAIDPMGAFLRESSNFNLSTPPRRVNQSLTGIEDFRNSERSSSPNNSINPHRNSSLFPYSPLTPGEIMRKSHGRQE